MPDIIVIGGGAAGLLAAGTAKDYGGDVIVFEKNKRVARKVLITGKGRCNLTNNTNLQGLISSVANGGRFLYSAFSQFSAEDTMALFEGLGVPLMTERGNRVFPKSERAVDIVDALQRYTKNVTRVETEVEDIVIENNCVKGVLLKNGETVLCKKVIVATGGLSYSATGSTGDGYKFAKSAGHTVTNLTGSLVPLEMHEGFCSVLQGLSLKNVGIAVHKEGVKKPIYTDFGELVFTHFGLSGPVVLSASSHLPDAESGNYTFTIDLKPALTNEMLDARLLKDFAKYSNRDFINSLSDLLPKSLISVIVNLSGISPHKRVNEITKAERQQLLYVLKNFKMHITGKRPIEEAIITSGGVKVSEINPATMESKLCSGLYFSGEVIDVDAYTGGFNLQIAFSTGYLAGKSSVEDV